MPFVARRMEGQRCCKESIFHTTFRSLGVLCLLVFLSVALYPGLWSMGARLYAVITGTPVAGHNSVLLIGTPNEQVAQDIGRAIMERQMAASINILPRTWSLYYWKGEVQEATEIVMVHPSLREPGRPEHGGGVHRCVLREVDGRGGPGRLTGQPGGVTPPDTHPPLHADLREPEP
ncbi:protein CutA homolog isoform X1 [Gadus morhua]|uniref:Zgc:63972 n=2 Tax=Gadus morhua TaxID=8049 RepID=A0A8C5AIQ8_GADMO|nr:protein CutA homolog isoform X1 [Gadus morhua]